MPATLDTPPLFLTFVTTEPGGAGSIARICAERSDPGGSGETHFDRIVRGPRLTMNQARMTGLTNAQIDAADDLDVVLEDLLEFSSGAELWVAALGAPARDALTAAAYSAGFPRFQTPPLIGIDELAAVVLPRVGKDKLTEHYRGSMVSETHSKLAGSTTSQKHGDGSHRGMGVSPMLGPATTAKFLNSAIQREEFQIRKGANLPHWTTPGGTYFVTFRLADSIPRHIQEQWSADKDALNQLAPQLSESQKSRQAEQLFEKAEACLSNGYGECWLKNPTVAAAVEAALHHFDDDRYRLLAWCLMSNHVHVVFKPIAPNSLSEIMHSWKSFTAKQANRLLKREGSFWQDESYDHLVRNETDLIRCIEYTFFNPEKAGLSEWKWRGVRTEIIETPARADFPEHGQDAHATMGNASRPSSATRQEVSDSREERSHEPVLSIKTLWQYLIADLLKLPLPVLSEMNWLLSKTDHPIKGLLKSAESQAVKQDFDATLNSGRLSLDKLFKDFSEIINRLGPDDENGESAPPPVAADEPPEIPVTAEDIDAVLGPDGPLAKHLEGFEKRPEQLAMAKRTAEAFNTGRHLISEAGTGIGKSLAYLVPAILFAKRVGRPVMISTHTKNLQSQLYEKDLPFLRKHMGLEFESSLLKGRPNYLCLRKFMFTLQESAAELDEGERAQMLPVMTWATQTDTGDVAELAAFSREQSPELWDRLHTVGDDCLKRQCPFYKRCFVYKARGVARVADVVVLNHSLVFSDLNLESGVLPPYNEIVFDEAHKLEDVATEHLACEVTPKRIWRILNKLFRVPQGSTAGKGVLAALLANVELSRGNFTEGVLDGIRTHLLNAMQAIHPANEGSDVFFETVRGWTERSPSDADEGPPQAYVPQERGRRGAPAPAQTGESFDPSTGELTPPAGFFKKQPRKFAGPQSDRRRYSAATMQPQDTERFTQGKEAVIARLGRLRQALNALEDDFKEIRKHQVPRARELLKEIEAQNLFLEELIHDIEFIVKGDEPNYVYWTEPLGRKGARVVAAPLDVSALLHSQLYEKKRSIILASATLSLRDSEADAGSGFAPVRVTLPRPSAQSRPAPETTITLGERPHPKSFEFIKNRIGLKLLSAEKLDELLLGSPFDYDSQCRLLIPTFLPEPGGARERDFSAAFSSMVAELAIATGGRAMVLYTSYAALDASAKLLRKSLAAEDIEVIAQGNDGSRESLLARLKEGKRTVLLGTASFWEGVDVRGDALSLLVIAKLPFAVFTDPIIEGRCELLEASGKDPFLHYSIPQAILKLRQGFGRLIRSKTDRGIVVLGDKRVVTRRYGAAFLRALPAKAQIMSSADTMTRTVREFLENSNASEMNEQA